MNIKFARALKIGGGTSIPEPNIAQNINQLTSVAIQEATRTSGADPAFEVRLTKTSGAASGSMNWSATCNTGRTVSIAAIGDANEGGPTPARLEATLSAASATDTIIRLTYGGTATSGSDYTSVRTVTIPAGALSSPITIPVLDDAIVEADEQIVVGLGLVENGQAAVVSPETALVKILSEDAGAMIIATTDGTATEEPGDTGTFIVALDHIPSGPVTVSVGTSTQCTFSPITLTFSTGNWNEAQAVSVVPIEDSVAEGPQTCAPSFISATDGGYSGVTATPPTISFSDSTVASVAVSGTPVVVSETGSSQSFTVVLTSQPTAEVAVPVVPSDTTEAIVSPALLTFTPVNWNVPQAVTVTGVDDVVEDGDVTSAIVVGTSTSSDPDYNNHPPVHATVTTTDDDATENAAVAKAFEAQAHNFMVNRMGVIASNLPTSHRLSHQNGIGSADTTGFNVSGNERTISGNFSLNSAAAARVMAAAGPGLKGTIVPTADVPELIEAPQLQFWTEGKFGIYRDNSDATTGKGDFLIGHAGLGYMVDQSLVVGVAGQLDWMEENQSGSVSSVHGTGWMLGAYLSGEPTEDVFLDVRAMWGRSRNNAVQEIFSSQYSGEFDTSRWLVQATVSGTQHFGLLSLTPEATVVYLRENQEAFTVTDGARTVSVGDQTADLGQLFAGLTVSHAAQLNGVSFEPFVTGRAVWSFADSGYSNLNGATGSNAPIRGQLRAGVNVSSSQSRLSADVTFNGLSADDFQSIAASLAFSHEF